MHGEGLDDDGLFTPSVRNEALPTPPPYRVSSTFYVGFFGGPLACTAVNVINARRLGIPERDRLWLLVIGGVGMIVGLAAAALLTPVATTVTVLHLVLQAAGALTHVLQARLLNPRERYWQMRGVEPASLWALGIFTAVSGRFVTRALVAAGFAGAGA